MNKEVNELLKRMRGRFQAYEEVARTECETYRERDRRLREFCDMHEEFEGELLDAAREETVIFDMAQSMWKKGMLDVDDVIAYIDAVPGFDYVESGMWDYVADKYDIPIPDEDFDPTAFLEAAKAASGMCE